MSETRPDAARDFAVEVVRRLQGAGHQAVWAGGCVRDRVLGRAAKDYDVATSALPGEIRELFGFRRTLAIGASFGVITVLGPKEAGQVEVATFRSDLGYTDGRHPDAITFTSAEEDAQRRDFTMNGLFYDPLAGQLFDYVGGRADLERCLVRAIGEPALRFGEDKLRMLRAIRFAATFEFAIERATLAAIQAGASSLRAVSAERIAGEMRRMLIHPNRATALRLLHQSCLLPEVLPELAPWALAADSTAEPGSAPSRWQRTLGILARLEEPSFPVALAATLSQTLADSSAAAAATNAVGRRWRLANEETKCVAWLLAHEGLVRTASRQAWPVLQRVLVAPGIHHLLALAQAQAGELEGSTAEVDFCREKLRLPPEVLNPPPLITGDHLVRQGMAPGPLFHRLLEQVRDAQLNGEIATADEALALAQELARQA